MDKTAIATEKSESTKPENDSPTFAVIFGGRGLERSVSVRGAVSFIRRAAALGYRLLPIFIDPCGRFLLYEGDPSGIRAEDLSALKTEAYPVRLFGASGFLISGEVIAVKRALIILHGDYGEDGTVQGALETAGIDYIGAQVSASVLSLDKYAAKCIARELGIPVLDFGAYGLKDGSFQNIKEKIERDIGYPVFIKPRRLGSSIGASAAFTEDELTAALKEAFSHSDGIIAERCLTEKRELEVAYYSLGETVGATHPAEIDLGGGFYSYSEKYSDKSSARLSVRADIPSGIAETLREYTLRLSGAIGIRHFARLDYFLTEDGIYFSEINTVPGMTEKSLFLSMLEADGIGFAELLTKLFGDER